MPLIRISVSTDINKNDQMKITGKLSATLCEILMKPEKYIQTIFHTNLNMTFSGNCEPNAFIEIKSIGSLPPENCIKITESFCRSIENELNIVPERVYIQFEDVMPSLWGWNNKTFG